MLSKTEQNDSKFHTDSLEKYDIDE